MSIEKIIGEIICKLEDTKETSRLLERLDMPSARYYFTCGGCYAFAKTLSYFLEGSQIVIKNDDSHCAVFYQGNVYDALGLVKDKGNYRIAREVDIDYMREYFELSRISFYDSNHELVTTSRFLINGLEKSFSKQGKKLYLSPSGR